MASWISQDVDFFFPPPHKQKQAKYRNVIMNTDINYIEHKSIGNAITYEESSVKKTWLIDFFKEHTVFPVHFLFISFS